MTLLNGQAYIAECPYFWTFCQDDCDGCRADQAQAKGWEAAPWAQGTTAWERHERAKEAVYADDDALARQLWEGKHGWRS